MKLQILLTVLLVGTTLSSEELKSNNGRFIGFGTVSTTTYTSVSLSTSSVYYSCLSGSYTALICQGRKKKAMRSIEDIEPAEKVSIDSSVDSAVDHVFDKEDDPNGDERLLTVWTVAKTTTTQTVFYTNTASTIKISYYCGAGGIQYPANSC